MRLAKDEIIENYIVTRRKRSVDFNMPAAHYHDHFEIYYLKSGSVRYFIDDRIYDLEKGDAILIPPHKIHKTAAAGNESAERLIVAFTNEFLARFSGEKVFKYSDVKLFKASTILRLIEAAEREMHNKDSLSDEIIAIYIRLILIEFERKSEKCVSPEEDKSIMARAVKFISENYSSDITLSRLASTFALSESHFSRQFKEYTGFGVSEYTALVRIKNAELLLSATKNSITDIAAMCGFNSSSYFSAVFRKIKGITPKERRRQMK